MPEKVFLLNLFIDEFPNLTIDELFYYKGISLENGKVYGYAR